jgi:hypothetical protein
MDYGGYPPPCFLVKVFKNIDLYVKYSGIRTYRKILKAWGLVLEKEPFCEVPCKVFNNKDLLAKYSCQMTYQRKINDLAQSFLRQSSSYGEVRGHLCCQRTRTAAARCVLYVQAESRLGLSQALSERVNVGVVDECNWDVTPTTFRHHETHTSISVPATPCDASISARSSSARLQVALLPEARFSRRRYRSHEDHGT